MISSPKDTRSAMFRSFSTSLESRLSPFIVHECHAMSVPYILPGWMVHFSEILFAIRALFNKARTAGQSMESIQSTVEGLLCYQDSFHMHEHVLLSHESRMVE